MRTNVQFENVKYVVKPEEGVVVCTMNVKSGLLKSTYHKGFRIKASWLKSLPMLDEQANFKVKGVAKCSGGDKFDEVLGKRIAEAKAKKMAFGICNTMHTLVFNKLTAGMTEYAEIAIGCGRACTTEKEHLDYLLDEADKKEE